LQLPKTYAGAQLKVIINGQLVAETRGFDYTVSYAQKGIDGIDTLLAFEQAPGMVGVSGSVSFYKLRFLGGLEGRGIVPTFNSATQQKYCVIQVMDRLLTTEILRIERVTVSSQSVSIKAKDIVTGSFSFSGIIMSTDFNPQD
jgi:hypothetical protein